MSELFILSQEKQRAFDLVPKFNSTERDVMFMLNRKARRALSGMNSDVNKVGYLLQRGYFQVKGRFFNPTHFRKVDINYVERLLGIKKPVDLKKYSSSTASNHRSLILRQYGWHPLNNRKKEFLAQHAVLHVDKQESTEDVLFAVFDHCWKHKIEIPSYGIFAEIISESYKAYEERILSCISENITRNQVAWFDGLVTGNNDMDIYISTLRKINQADSTRALNENARLIKYCKRFHTYILPLLNKLALSKQADKNFAARIYKSTQRQIENIRDVNRQRIYLAAFIKDQFYLRQDYAIDAILKIAQKLHNSATKFQVKKRLEIEPDVLAAAGKLIDHTKTADEIISLIYSVNTDPTLTKHEASERTVQLIESYLEAKDPALVTNLSKLGAMTDPKNNKSQYYKKLEEESRKIFLKLKPFIKCLEFDETHSAKEFIEAVNYFKNHDGKIGSDAPMAFLKKKHRENVVDDEGHIKVALYRSLFFIMIAEAIKERKLNLRYSYRFLANNRLLIPDTLWDTQMDHLIDAADMNEFKDAPSILADLEEELKQTYRRVNKNYRNGDNPYLQYSPKQRWHVNTPKTNYEISKYIPKLLGTTKFLPLSQLIGEIDLFTNFSESFVHQFVKTKQKKLSKNISYAILMSLGCNIGHRKLAGSSLDKFSDEQLSLAEDAYFTSENIRKANGVVIDTIQSLPLPTIYNAEDNTLHTSSDGKKVVVAVNSLLANYSYKYYGKEKGVTVNSFLDEKQTFFHVNVLSSSDREAPYMMDGLVNYRESLTTDKHLHSTDTHGFTEAIFSGLHFLNISFAPRLANVGRLTLYGFKKVKINPRINEIVPTSVINKKLILDNWDSILRLMVTIKLGYSSASLLFKKLAASAKHSQLYKALKEFGRILKTKYILEYFDDIELRHKVQKQLGRIELGQKLQSAIFFGRKGVFYVGTDVEMERAVACSTLLRNLVILWNYLFLSHYILKANKSEKESIISSISSGSVIAWNHINMFGEYDFSRSIQRVIQSELSEMLALKV